MPWGTRKHSRYSRKAGYKPAKYFQRRVIDAFTAYLRTASLPRRDRALVAHVVCELAPEHNPHFLRDKFLQDCGLSEIDLSEFASRIGT